jgi:hypothetical protein
VIIRNVKATFKNTTDKNAPGFQAQIDGGSINPTPAPDSSVYGTVDILKESSPPTALMYNGNVPGGGSHRVFISYTFNTKFAKGRLTTEFGTVDNNLKFKSLGEDSSERLALSGNLSNDGNLASLTLVNDSGSPLVGTVGVFVETGLSDFANPDQFDQPHGETVLSASRPFSLSDGGVFNPSPITAGLSADQYLLVRGTVDDSTGVYAFSEGFALAPVPEPSPLVLGAGATTLGLLVWWVRRLLGFAATAPAPGTGPGDGTAEEATREGSSDRKGQRVCEIDLR